MNDRPTELAPAIAQALPQADGSFFMTADLSGVGGVLKEHPEDFLVEEIPAYEPVGSGEHWYVFIEKRDATTSQAIGALSKRFNLHRKNVGCAGLKDRHAVTRQWISLHDPGRCIPEADLVSFETQQVRVLHVDRHTNKLRRGHLRGNRFRIALRQVSVGSAPRALAILRVLEKKGSPNFFGAQRFGRRANNHLLGRAIITGRYDEALDHLLGASATDADQTDPMTRIDSARQFYSDGQLEDALAATPRFLSAERQALLALSRGAEARGALRAVGVQARQLWLSAFQAAVFDEALLERANRGALDVLEVGDLAFKHDSGAVFEVAPDVLNTELTERLERLEISPSGPMWGPAMKRATGAADQREMAALVNAGVTIESLERFGEEWRESGMGVRRSMRIKVGSPNVEAGVDDRGEYVTCVFELPPGAYATAVMGEVMKTTSAPAARAPW